MQPPEKGAAIRRAFAIFAVTEMPRTSYITVSLPAEDYLRSYCDARRIAEYCRACGNYGKIWSCPPFDADRLERLAGYGHVRIIGAVVTLDAEERHRPADASEAVAAAYAIVEDARRPMDARLLEAEGRHPGSRALFAGSCLLCGRGDCLRTEGRPCRYPDRARTSLEACGFDVARTAEELLGLPLRWNEGPVLPPYFTLVGGLFTKEKTEESEWTHA